MLLPILAGPLEKCLDDLIIDTAPKNPGHAEHRGPVLRYFDHVLPLRGRRADLPLGVLLAAAALPAGRLARRGHPAQLAPVLRHRHADRDPGRGSRRVRGHPPGAAAAGPGGTDRRPAGGSSRRPGRPGGYLRRLAAATGGALDRGGEDPGPRARSCPPGPAPAPPATTRSPLVDGLFIDPAGEQPLTEAYVRFTGGKPRLRRGGPGRQAGYRRRHVHRRTVPADPAVRPRGLPGPGRRSARPTCTTCWSSCWPRSTSTGRT